MDKVQILDHGYVQFVEHWGSDERIVEAARMSTDKGFEGWGPKPCKHCGIVVDDHGTVATLVFGIGCEKCHHTGKESGDEKLLHYLYSHKHMTPFEMGGLIVEVQAPIFVFREWHRHRTQSYNEMSGRYIELPKLCYVPSAERVATAKQAAKNKQSSQRFEGDELFYAQESVQGSFSQVYEFAWMHYQSMLALGVARELASRVLPTSQYSRMRASANLRCWLMFLTLRMDAAAQWEIRQYANEVGKLIEQMFPRTWALFADGLQ